MTAARSAFGGMLAALVLAAPASAYVAPGARIVSASSERREQGDDSTTAVAISGDGRFAVFRTQARNLFPDDVADPPGAYRFGGVFRRDLESGRLELVALGDLRREGDDAQLVRGAENPSVSADGRSVAFSTAERLVAADVNDHIDVYVRDMDRPRADPLAYELISARDGTGVPARYGGPAGAAGELRSPGSDVSTGAAISADGRRVVFRTVERDSDLPDRAAVDTPPFQVLVRDRVDRTTRLITRVAGDPSRPAGGALAAAVISADGSTVAWQGRNAEEQTRFLSGEISDPNAFYYLWQRIDDPAPQTRRVTGAADPDDPGCGDYFPDDTAQGPCYGPLAESEQSVNGIGSSPPALSGDGRTVAFVTGASPRPRRAGLNLDLFVTGMAPSTTRKSATIELTREGTNDQATSAPIASVALSADARFAAVVTARTRFLLPVLRVTTPTRAVAGPGELYLVDLAAGTIERAVRGRAGGDASGPVNTGASVSRDGRRTAFTSPADNLFVGDANQRTDAFVIDRLDAAPPAAEVEEPPDEPAAEALPDAEPPPARLRVFVRRARRGRVRLEVVAPVAGALSVDVRGRLPDADGRLRGRPRLLASGTRRVRRSGRVRIDLPLRKRYGRVLRRERRLNARAAVRLAPAAGRPLGRETAVRFDAPARRSG